MRSFITSFFALYAATITVESFQPSRVSSSSLLRLQESSSFFSEDKEEKSAPFFAAAESSPTIPFPSSTSNAGAVVTVVAAAAAAAAATTPPDIAISNNDSDSVSSLQQVQIPPAKTMDEGIYGFNKAVIDTVYDIICFLYPVKGNARDYARFYVLETVARVPYFAYLSVMHLRETFGERYPKMSDRMRTHYAEADNELHHLLIMESLGGNSNIIDRTLAQTMAFGYYWYVIVIYTFNESAAYHLSELIEDHAYNTYSKFTTEYEERLKLEPVPDVARKYYELDNPFLFDLFCTVKNKSESDSSSSIDGIGNYSSRRPQLTSLYDVFINIRDDEKEHWKTLCNLVQYDDMNAVDATEVQSTTPSAPSAAVATATD